jgi:glucose/arabinose dehydrogenase
MCQRFNGHVLIRAGLGIVVAAAILTGCGSGGDGTSQPRGPTTGSLAVTISGLPAGTSAAVTVTGPAGFSRSVTGTETLGQLTPGSYTISASSVTASDGRYAPSPATLSVTVAAGSTPASASVTYALATGSLTVTISGLPAGASGDVSALSRSATPEAAVDARVTVTGPAGFTRALTATQTLVGLDPGSYTVAAAEVTTTDTRYAAAPATQNVTVNAGSTPATASVAYTLVSGRLAVTIAGLPQGATANVLVSGPNAFSRVLTSTTTLTLLAPGTYTISATDVSAGNFTYRGSPTTQTATVAASADAATSSVTYAAIDGAVSVSVTGLPTGAAAAITVTGPAGFSQSLTGTATLVRLASGTYTISAANVTSGSTTYVPAPPTQSVTVAAGVVATANIAYAAPVALRLTPIVSGLSSPVHMVSPPGDPRFFIVEQAGRIQIVKNGQILSTPFITLASRIKLPTSVGDEHGLLGLAFHPQYATNGYFFVYYTSLSGDVIIERFQVSSNPDVASTSGTIVIVIPHSADPYHNGGGIAFGPDGYLYLGVGDGGCCRDPFQNGQNTNSLLGKLLRIDVTSLPYSIPASNPFVGQANRRAEIWSYGLRNPWRFDIDAASATLYIADVGEDTHEEVDAIPLSQGGVNFGWSIMEGPQCLNPGCSTQGLTLPVLSYDHLQGCSITGGYVYRGTQIPEVAGHYFYSDYCRGFLRSFLLVNGVATQQRDWAIVSPGFVTSFGKDSSGELYVLTHAGALLKLVRQ